MDDMKNLLRPVTVYNESRTIRRRNKPQRQVVHDETDSIDMAIYNNILQLRVEITGPSSSIYIIYILIQGVDIAVV